VSADQRGVAGGVSPGPAGLPRNRRLRVVFCVRDYDVHVDFGGDEALARLRERMRARVCGSSSTSCRTRRAGPRWCRSTRLLHRGHGGATRGPPRRLPPCRESAAGAASWPTARPVFPGWPDTLQLNYGNPALQAAMIGELQRVAKRCDGVRCDMAMLVLPEIFERDLGTSRQPFWRGPRGKCARRCPVPLPGRGLLGPRVDAPAAGVSTTPTTSGSTTGSSTEGRARARALPRRARLPGPPGALPGEPRRTARRGHLHPDVHRAAAVITFLGPGSPLLPPGTAGGERVRIPTHLGRGPARCRTRPSPRSTTGCSRA